MPLTTHLSQPRRGETSSPHAGKSFWLADYGAYNASASLRGAKTCDVLVVGGGIAGLSTAWHLAKDSSTRVILIESEIIGFGASGRAAGWIMPQFGMDQLKIRARYGFERSQAALTYGLEAVSYTGQIISDHGIKSDYRRPGLMRVAFDDSWINDLAALYKNYDDLGLKGLHWSEGQELHQQYNGNTNFKAAIVDPNLGLLNPCKQVRGLKELAESVGVSIFENSPAVHIDHSGGHISVATPAGCVATEKIVLATNAFTHLLQGPLGAELKRVQAPVRALAAVTEPLSQNQWQSIGWNRGNAIESSLDLFHYLSPTADGRILFFFIYFGGHPKHGSMDGIHNYRGSQVSLDHVKRIFPALDGIRLAEHWGGHMSATRDLVPHLTHIGDERVIYIGGCWGHGLALSHLHGKTAAHLLLGKQSSLTDFWFINRKPVKWPRYPIDAIGKQLAWAHLRRQTSARLKKTIFDSRSAMEAQKTHE